MSNNQQSKLVTLVMNTSQGVIKLQAFIPHDLPLEEIQKLTFTLAIFNQENQRVDISLSCTLEKIEVDNVYATLDEEGEKALAEHYYLFETGMKTLQEQIAQRLIH